MWWTDSLRGWFLMKFCPSSTSNLEVVQVNSTKPEHSWFRFKVQTQSAMRSYFFCKLENNCFDKKTHSYESFSFVLFMFLFPLKAPFSFFLSVKWNACCAWFCINYEEVCILNANVRDDANRPLQHLIALKISEGFDICESLDGNIPDPEHSVISEDFFDLWNLCGG